MHWRRRDLLRLAVTGSLVVAAAVGLNALIASPAQGGAPRPAAAGLPAGAGKAARAVASFGATHIAVLHARSQCTVEAGSPTIRFQIALRNSGAAGMTVVRPWVGFSDGSQIRGDNAARDGVSVPTTGGRAMDIVVGYSPKLHRPTACRVYLSNGYASIAVRS